MNITREFIKFLKEDLVLVHPTDTIPGVTYLPTSEKAFSSLCQVKNRNMSKTCIGLINSFEMAKRCFHELSDKDLALLKKYWPAPLSVVARASSDIPSSMLRDDATISLRFPVLEKEHQWLFDVIDEIAMPLPTTSINRSGESAAHTWLLADMFAESHDSVINLVEPYQVKSSLPSTIVSLSNGKFKILRQGILELDQADVEV